jgi:hypothetical protein
MYLLDLVKEKSEEVVVKCAGRSSQYNYPQWANNQGKTEMNPYIEVIRNPIKFMPIKRNLEQEAVEEGLAMYRSLRIKRKGRQMVKTRTSRLSQREAA